MYLWVVGSGVLWGILSGIKKNRTNLAAELPYGKIAEITGEKVRKKCRPIYLRQEGKRSIIRNAVMVSVFVLTVFACYLFGAGEVSLPGQLLPAVWMWYFTDLLVTSLTRKSMFREPVMVLAGNGLWIKDDSNFRHVGWESVGKVLVMNSKGTLRGGIIEKTLSFKPRRIEIDFKDGTMFAADGIHGNIMPLADRFSEWVPVRNVKLSNYK